MSSDQSGNETAHCSSDTESGLYDKYEVRKGGETIEDCFVLEPESDGAALEALRTYADETTNRKLRSELRGWIMAIDERKRDSESDCNA